MKVRECFQLVNISRLFPRQGEDSKERGKTHTRVATQNLPYCQTRRPQAELLGQGPLQF